MEIAFIIVLFLLFILLEIIVLGLTKRDTTDIIFNSVGVIIVGFLIGISIYQYTIKKALLEDRKIEYIVNPVTGKKSLVCRDSTLVNTTELLMNKDGK
jgi:uncharacterized membrane protein YbhN (UPF0104 family)